MQRNCDYCGRPYEAKKPTSRFCETKCRVANNQKPDGRVAPVVPIAEASKTSAGDSPVVAQVKQELDDAGRLGTALGQIALAAAYRLDGSTFDTGSAYASLLRELRACLDAALDGAKVAGDPGDELRERRERRRSG